MTLHDNAQFTTMPLNALSDQGWIRYACLSLLLVFICGFSAKMKGAFLAFKKHGEIHRNKNFSSQKKKLSSTFLIILRFQGYRCKSGIAILSSGPVGWLLLQSYLIEIILLKPLGLLGNYLMILRWKFNNQKFRHRFKFNANKRPK